MVPYIHRLIDPSEVTEQRGVKTDEEKCYFDFTEDDYLSLLAKEPESLFPEATYMKHLRRHTNKCAARVRHVHVRVRIHVRTCTCIQCTCTCVHVCMCIHYQ